MMQPYLELEVRKKIYDCIDSSPGIHFREVQRRVGLATGSIDYHLHFLHKHGLIRVEKRGKFSHYYTYTRNWETEEKDILNLLRQKMMRHILIYLIERKRLSASKLAFELGISPSNLSWYLKQLLGRGLVRQKKKGRFRIYSAADKKIIIKYLIMHKSSFLDELVDRFIETWEEE